MITNFLTRIFSSRPAKLILALVVFTALVSQGVPYMVESAPYVERVKAAIREGVGAELQVKGASRFQLLPRPALVMHSLELLQPEATHAPALSVDTAELDIDLLSLASGSPRIDKVRMQGVSAVAEKEAAGTIDMGVLGLATLKKLAAIKPEHPVQFEITSGSAALANVKTGETVGLSNIVATGTLGVESRIAGVAFYADKTIQFMGTRSGVIGATPITLTLNSGKGDDLAFKGSMDFTANYPLITGKIDVAVADIASLYDKNDHPPRPFKFSADYVQKEEAITFSNIALDALNSRASGTWVLSTSKGGNSLASLRFSVLDLASARQVAAAYISSVTTPDATREPKDLFDKSMNVALDITADTIQNGMQPWGKAGLDATASDGVLTVNKLSFTLPGESTLALFGLVSVSDTQGIRFQGNTEAEGNSLREVLTVFDESAGNLPALGFGAYKLRSNLFISRELLRLSEADAKFSELSLKGGLVAYFDSKPRIEADIGLRDINFDYVRDSWRANVAADKGADTFFNFDRTMNFDWLKKLSASIDFRVSVQDFTFFERHGTNASFRLFAQGGEFGIYNAKFQYGTDTTEANLKLDVTGAQPNINLVLNTAALSTNYFAAIPKAPEPVEPPPAPVPSMTSGKGEPLPEMLMPSNVTPEEELRAKIAEEAAQMGETGTPATPAGAITPPITVIDDQAATSATPATPLIPAEPATPATPTPAPQDEVSAPVELTPADPEDQIEIPASPYDDSAADDTGADDTQTIITTEPQSLLIREAMAQEAELQVSPNAESLWSDKPLDMSFMEGFGGTFDISIGRMQHKNLVFQNFKMMAKLDRNLLVFQTLTFMHWGGSFSINGTLFGGKVPGLSLGFVAAGIDIEQMLGTLLHMEKINGRASISGTIDTSGVNPLSWVSQASGKMMVAARGMTISGLDVASVITAVSASRTAADVFNNVNLSLVNGTGEYSADGAINMQKGAISTPGIALKTGKIVGTVTGDFRPIPWDVNLTATFQFPELSAENVPTMTARWSGSADKPSLQTDTQALEAFVSKRITGH